MSAEADRRRHRRRRLHRQPHGRPAARPRLRRARRSTTWSAGARPTSRSTRAIRTSMLEQRDIRALAPGRRAVRRRRRTCSTSPASATSCPRSSGRSSTCRPTCRAPCTCSNARAHAGVEKFVYAASSSCYGLAATPTREDHPIAPQYPYALSQVPGRAGGVPLAPGLRAAGQLDPHLQCLRHRASRTSGAYGAVFGVFLAPEARRQAVHGRRRRHADARLPLRHRRRRGLPARPPRRRSPARSGISAPATRSRSTGWSSCSAARSSTSRSARASPTAPGPTSPRSRASSAGSRRCRFEDGVGAHAGRHRATGATRRCGIRSRSPRRRETWFRYLGQERALMHVDRR